MWRSDWCTFPNDYCRVSLICHLYIFFGRMSFYTFCWFSLDYCCFCGWVSGVFKTHAELPVLDKYFSISCPTLGLVFFRILLWSFQPQELLILMSFKLFLLFSRGSVVKFSVPHTEIVNLVFEAGHLHLLGICGTVSFPVNGLCPLYKRVSTLVCRLLLWRLFLFLPSVPVICVLSVPQCSFGYFRQLHHKLWNLAKWCLPPYFLTNKQNNILLTILSFLPSHINFMVFCTSRILKIFLGFSLSLCVILERIFFVSVFW